MQSYIIIGKEPIDIIIELGLGSCKTEWVPFANSLAGDHGVLLYERAGINKSAPSNQMRTPSQIATELYELLSTVKHEEKLLIIAHSQGGLYAQQFCRLYPEFVKALVLLDPLSASDHRFKDELTKQEYKKSGVDKGKIYKVMATFAKLGLGCITKQLLKTAPPLCYSIDYSKEEKNEILNCAYNATHAATAYDEYVLSHDEAYTKCLEDKASFPQIPLILITHSSEHAIEESMKFGHNSREFASKIDAMWQDIMKDYLSFSSNSHWLQAKKSSHYIHLQEPELVLQAIRMVDDYE